MNRQRLLDRFLSYVQVDTTADEHARMYPSSPGQWELGKQLVRQLHSMGLHNAHQDSYGLVHATIAATDQHASETIVLNAHLDTSPETSGVGVRPQVIREYTGGDITLPCGGHQAIIRVDDNPELKTLQGKTLITSDGSTLLGADDKAGVAIIMEVAECLVEAARDKANAAHGPVKILFTCDEEIGRGVNHVDIDALRASACYTLDGPGAGHIDVETFSADLAVVSIRGINIHPSIAKDRMVNAVKVAAAIVDRLPSHLAPETTSGRDGFLHPYLARGSVADGELHILIRDFDTAGLAQHADQLREIISHVQSLFPHAEISLDVQRQYRNLGDGLSQEPRAVALAEQAHHNLGYACLRSIIRGGTDGSRLTELGLPTPNLSSGQHTPHSALEWACLEEMEQAVAVTRETIRLWANSS